MTIQEQWEAIYVLIFILLVLCLIPISKFLKRPALNRKSKNPDVQPKRPQEKPSISEAFSGFIGNERAIGILSDILSYSDKSKTKVPNLAIFGPRSTGKSELVRRISRFVGLPSFKWDRTSLSPTRMAKLLAEMAPNQIVSPCIFFIDEVHAIPRAAQDALLTATEPRDGALMAGGLEYDVSNVLFIVATTDPGKLTDAFRSRFNSFELEEYNEEEVATILKSRSVLDKKFPNGVAKLDPEAYFIIAKLAKCIPRQALIGLEHIGRLVDLKKVDPTDLEDIKKKTMTFFNCDNQGLTDLDKKYIQTIERLGPIGQRALCSILNVDKDTLEKMIEPFLMREGYVRMTSRGRVRKL